MPPANRWEVPGIRRPAVLGRHGGHGGLHVHSGTAQSNAEAYTWNMQLLSIKRVIAILWVSAMCIIGIAGNLDSFSNWAVLTGFAVVPPLVMMWRWNEPRQTMSESIQQARR
jgi:hypothetical protein